MSLKQDNPATMQSYNQILCDMNVDLWQDALHATLREISSNTYPHYIAIQKILNYTLVSNTRCFFPHKLTKLTELSQVYGFWLGVAGDFNITCDSPSRNDHVKLLQTYS